MHYIERWFCLLIGEQKHLDLSFRSFVKVCANSELNTTSELEVVNAIESWINHRERNRIRFAFDLSKKIRLPLLSTAAKKNLLSDCSLFTKCKKSEKYIKNAPRTKKQLRINPASLSLQNRYCSQESFDLLVSDGDYYRRSKVLYLLNNNSVSRSITLHESDYKTGLTELVYLNMHIYSVYESRKSSKIVVRSFSLSENKWSEPFEYDKNQSVLGARAFMGKVCIVGIGRYKEKLICFNPRSGGFEEGAELRERRSEGAACCVFGGRIVVSGGESHVYKKSVEAHDASANRWVKMPRMVEGRSQHHSAAVRNKLYVFGGVRSETCEVFDFLSNAFVLIKSGYPFGGEAHWRVVGTNAAIGSKILVFNHYKLEAALFDTETEEFSEARKVSLEKIQPKDFQNYSCLKLPR